jgi:putative transposase
MYFHVWFLTKYRKSTLDGQLDKFVKDIFSECIQRHNYNVLEFETNNDHVHMLVEAKDKLELAAILRTSKSVSAREIRKTPHYRVGNTKTYYTRKCIDPKGHFWARRYGSKEIGISEIPGIKEYIRNQKKQ